MSRFSPGEDEPTIAEWAVVVASTVVTVSLFGYVVWHAGATPAGTTPEASVVGIHPMDDRVVVTVEVHNPGATGLEAVTVSADCSDASVRFEHVPTAARRTGSLVCPAGADDPSVSIQSWIEA